MLKYSMISGNRIYLPYLSFFRQIADFHQKFFLKLHNNYVTNFKS